MAKLLANLPQRGILSDATVSSSYTLGLQANALLPTYVCDYNTDPPPDQVIRTDPTNILIRSLTINRANEREGGAAADAKGKDVKGKRALGLPDATPEASAKRPCASPALKETPGPRGQPKDAGPYTEGALRGLTTERLKAMLKDKNLSLKGKKEELVQRYLHYQQRKEKASQPSGSSAASSSGV